MRKLKAGDRVKVSRPVFVRKKDGTVENLTGRIVPISDVFYRKSRCDVGLEKPVLIPNTHLEPEVAA